MESRHCVWISGSYGLGDELAKLDHANRRPVWSSRQKAFCVSEQTARRAIAALEHAGWEVEGPRAARQQTETVQRVGQSDSEPSLW
jgi:hypothetical protein